MYTAHVHFFTNLDLFCIDNARVIYRKIRYISLKYVNCFCLRLVAGGNLSEVCAGCPSVQVSGRPLLPLQSNKLSQISIQITSVPSL